MATTRPMTGKRLSNSASFSSRKVAPSTSDVHVHSFGNDEHKRNSPSKNYKEEKLAAGLRANDNYDYVEAVRQFSLIKPDTILSLYYTGCARLELQYYLQNQESIIDFTKCIELSSRTEQSPYSLDVWYKRALAYHYINKYDEAIRDYTEYIHRCLSLGEQGTSEIHRGLIGRGLTYQVIYELDRAMLDMNEANRLTYNRNPYYLCCRASLHVSRNERQKALEDISYATNLGCDRNVEALFQRAIVLAELGRHNAALEDLTKALAMNNKPTEQANISYRSGLSDYALNNKEQAYQWFGRAILLHPYHSQAYYHLGIMQREKGQYKEALKSLNRANELSPQQGDILLERSIVNQYLGKTDDSIHDRKRGIQLNSSPYELIKILGKRIKKVHDEIDRVSATPYTHLELATAYDGLFGIKKEIPVKNEYYKLAVIEYRATIQTDTKYLYPQAYALLALCQKKMNNLIEAHESHMKFYEILIKHRGAIYHWKKYLLDVKDKMEINQIEPHLDENSISKLIHMELNRRKRDMDLETFQNDIEDKYKNQLNFYEQMRMDLANILTAITVLNLDNKYILDNTEDTANRVGKIIELLSVRETSISKIESGLNSGTKVNSNILKNINYDMIKMYLKSIGNIGDMTEQLDVAQLVARHLCTRYHSQLICLKPNHQYSYDNDNKPVQEKSSSSSSSSWWNCCSKSKVSSPKQPIYTDKQDTIRKLSTFATAFIIHAINNETIRISSNTKSERKDALATSLVLVVCEADLNEHGIQALSSTRYGNETLPIDLSAVTNMLKTRPISNPEGTNLFIEWKLYGFFRAPGIYYYTDTDTGKIRYYDSGPLMMSNIYGYRLGTKEEVDILRKLQKENIE